MLVKNILYLWAVFEYNVRIAKHEIKPEASDPARLRTRLGRCSRVNQTNYKFIGGDSNG
ncbi:hypothetical protein [Paenibacillus sp. JZ16]|uniref:hypothetical protein n=1 Tax=Paenibacillus sp. JZ16 TaxID=1906272 RepID=UPI00188A86D0|nr:hypothetical protein [Paenibacillus sp. JZ16]